MSCEKHHRFAKCWDSLSNLNNGEDGCNLCPGCAFSQGLVDGLRNQESDFDSVKRNIPEWDIGKNKNAREAYEHGHVLGKRMFDGYLP